MVEVAYWNAVPVENSLLVPDVGSGEPCPLGVVQLAKWSSQAGDVDSLVHNVTELEEVLLQEECGILVKIFLMFHVQAFQCWQLMRT